MHELLIIIIDSAVTQKVFLKLIYMYILTLSSLGFLEVSQPGGGGGGVDSNPHQRNFLITHPKHVKLGLINKWRKFYTSVVSIFN